MSGNEFGEIFPCGDKDDGNAQYFIGQSYLAPLVDEPAPVSNVTFEPGCRNNWHVHHGTNGGGDSVLAPTPRSTSTSPGRTRRR